MEVYNYVGGNQFVFLEIPCFMCFEKTRSVLYSSGLNSSRYIITSIADGLCHTITNDIY